MKVKEESEKVGLKLNIQKTKIMASKIICHHFMANRWEKNENSERLFSWTPKSLQMVTASNDQPTRHIKKQRHYFANKCASSQSYGFSSSHVWM